LIVAIYKVRGKAHQKLAYEIERFFRDLIGCKDFFRIHRGKLKKIAYEIEKIYGIFLGLKDLFGIFLGFIRQDVYNFFKQFTPRL